MKVALYTLGCKMNQYETQAMEQILRQRGHEIVDFSEEADAYVVNSCSVTAVSDQKSRQMLHRVRRQHPDAVAALCGCYPQTHAEDVRALDVDLIAGTGDRIGFVELLEEAAEKKGRIEAIDQSFERRVFEVLPAGGLDGPVVPLGAAGGEKQLPAFTAQRLGHCPAPEFHFLFHLQPHGVLGAGVSEVLREHGVHGVCHGPGYRGGGCVVEIDHGCKPPAVGGCPAAKIHV